MPKWLARAQGPGREKRAGLVPVAVAISMLLASCGSTGNQPAANATPQAGGVVRFAQVGPVPNYIFPLTPAAQYTMSNVAHFQDLMYRPLYWFGSQGRPVLNRQLSLAAPPVYTFHDTVVTITLRHFNWSNGQPVDSRDVVFWLNMLKAEKQIWPGYLPGQFPDNVVAYSAPTPDTVVLHLDHPYNPTWFTYNELSQITPLPLAWDRLSPYSPVPTPSTPNLPDTTTWGATALFNQLTASARAASGFVSSPIWSVVDGPWKLQSITPGGQVSFVANPAYSGPNKPTISRFTEIFFPNSKAERSYLLSSPSKATIGTLASWDTAGIARAKALGYHIGSSSYPFRLSYFVANLTNPTYGPIFRQAYFRQAFQHLVDQKAWVHTIYGGHALVGGGLVPSTPGASFGGQTGAALAKSYTYSVSDAISILSSHGWKVTPGGVSTCVAPGTGAGECGQSIAQGTALRFPLLYATAVPTLAATMHSLATDAAKAGIQLLVSPAPKTKLAAIQPCLSGTGSSHAAAQATAQDCSWALANWGGGVPYGPRYYPAVGSLVGTGGRYNAMGYSSAAMDAEVAKVQQSGSPSMALAQTSGLVSTDLPFFSQPLPAGAAWGGGLVVTAGNLRGFSANPYGLLDPERWRLKTPANQAAGSKP